MSASGQSGRTGAPPDRLRTHAIQLYCRELCGSNRMTGAAADVIGSISPADADGGDDQLLRVTRSAAAAHAPRKASPSGLRGVLAAEHQSECDLTPALLAERANGELPPARQFKLENHLARCLFCGAAEVREQRASRAFSAVLATGDPVSRRAPEPTPPAPEPNQEPSPADDSEPPPDPQPTTELPAPPHPPLPPARGRRGMAVFPSTSAGAANPPPRRLRSSYPRPPVLTAYAPFLITLALGAVVIVAVALALGGGNSQPSAASLPPPAASSTPPAAVGIAITGGANHPAQAGQPGQQPAAPATPATTTTSRSSTPSSQPGAAAPPTP